MESDVLGPLRTFKDETVTVICAGKLWIVWLWVGGVLDEPAGSSFGVVLLSVTVLPLVLALDVFALEK